VPVIHLDQSVLATLQEVMEDEYSTLLEVFLQDSEARIVRIRHLMAQVPVDLLEVSMTAHSFKGSSSNMGAMRLVELCRELEDRTRERQVDGLARLLASVEDEYSIVRRLFDAELQLLVAHH
jgi:HPt (histidine-containing phosphotransfer) domain-containing protein